MPQRGVNPNFGRLFLDDPRDLLELEAEPPWGDRAAVIDFTGGPYLFTGLDQDQVHSLREAYGRFCTTEGQVIRSRSPVETRVCRAVAGTFRMPSQHEMPEYELELDRRPDEVLVAGLWLLARVCLAPSVRATLWTSPHEDPAWFARHVINNHLRVVTAYRLLARGGVLLHSAGIVDGGRAHLFVGTSGAGKTTLSRLSEREGLQVLSDDLNGVVFDRGRPMVERLPFTGEMARDPVPTGAFPLAAVYRIEKASENAVRPLDPARAVSQMVANAPFVNTDPASLATLMDNLSNIVGCTSTHTLSFTIDGGAWSTIRGADAQGDGGPLETP